MEYVLILMQAAVGIAVFLLWQWLKGLPTAMNPAVNYVPEKSLVGKYLSDTGMDVTPADEVFVDRLIDSREEFGITRLLRNYRERVACGNEGIEYHAILTELAKLRRNMLKIFRDRFHWAMRTCREDEPMKPSRFYFPITQCSFVVIPLPVSQRENWQRTIQMYAALCKYDLRSPKCIALTVALAPDSDEHYLVNWCFLAAPWESDPEFELFLAENSMFRDMRTELPGKYYFADA